MTRVILVRHALSEAEPDVDSRLWRLADGAFAEAERLARSLPDDLGGPVWSSSETKAVETAHAIAHVLNVDVAVDERFGEVTRAWTAGDYRSLAKRYLAGEALDGWEPSRDVARRFAAALEDAPALSDHEVVVVNHGLALTVHVTSIVDVDPCEFWSDLRFPDAWRLDEATRSMQRLYTAESPQP